MSSTLCWRLVPKPAEHDLPCELKYIISPYVWEHDGTLGSPWTIIGREVLPFLKGVRSGSDKKNVRDAIDTLIEKIEQYGAVEIATIQ